MLDTRRLSIFAALLGLASLLPVAAQATTVASITLTAPSKTLAVGASETLTAVAKDSKGHAISGVAFTWSSGTHLVVSVTTKGVAKGLLLGSSAIKVTGGGKSATVTLTTTAASITLTTPNKTLLIDHSETLTAAAKDTNGHTISGVKFTWASSKTTVVSIRSTGAAKGLLAGKSTITVTGGGKTATVAITVPKTTGLAGIAARGTAIAGATVTLVDAKGVTASTTTDVDGGYTLDTSGLKPPFLVSVKLGDTPALYSVSADADVASVINISPLTDLIVRSWYSVQSVDIAAAFANPKANPPPTPTEVQLISNVVVQVTALWLQQAGVDTSNFSPISTPFVADGTGADAVLDQTSIDTDTGAITITDGTTTQSSTVTYDTDAGSVSVANNTTGADGSSSSVTGTVVATTTDMETALTGITTALDGLAAVVSTNGASLTANEVKPFLDANLLNEGLNKTQFAANIADQFRQFSSVSFTVLNIASLDTVNGLADVNFTFTAFQGDQSQTQAVEFFFRQQGDGTWKLYGSQVPATMSIVSEMRTNQGAFTDDNGPDINVDIRPIQGTYSGITIDGGPFSNTALSKQGTEVDTYRPDPSSETTVVVDLDEFFANSGVLVALVPPGTPLTVTMTPISGSPQEFTVKTNAFTTEAISITNLTGSTLADAQAGGDPIHVEWTLPKTFAIAEVKLNAQIFDGDQTQNTTHTCSLDGPILLTTATSGNISIPATCDGNPVQEVNLNLEVTGVNGERDSVIYGFKGAAP